MIKADEARNNVKEYYEEENTFLLSLWKNEYLDVIYDKIQRQSRLGARKVVLDKKYKRMPIEIQKEFINNGYKLEIQYLAEQSETISNPTKNSIHAIKW